MLGIVLLLSGESLNPCCNGRGSKTMTMVIMLQLTLSLNPCCNGRGSKTCQRCFDDWQKNGVLILVVMEEGRRRGRYRIAYLFLQECLNPCCNGRVSKTISTVTFKTSTKTRLNPCCNGRGSKTFMDKFEWFKNELS